MPRPALSANRATQVLSRLALQPDGRWTIAELSRSLEINLSSLHAVLATLQAEGYVRRDPVGRSYRLGPSALALGLSGLQAQPVVAQAERALEELTVELDLEGFITSACGDVIVVLARVGKHRPSSPSLRIAQRVPLLPPVGGVFMAWAQPMERAIWLERAPAAQRSQYAGTLELIHKWGYAVALEGPERESLINSVRDAQHQTLTDAAARIGQALDKLSQVPYLLGEGQAETGCDVSLIASPVFDLQGNVEIALTLTGFASSLPVEQIHLLGQRLRDTSIVLTRANAGVIPS